MRYFQPFLVGGVCFTFRMRLENEMTMNLFWRELYKTALVEVQPERLRERIDAAEKAIRQRSDELKQAGGYAGEETAAMADALRTLRVLAQSECEALMSSRVNAVKGGVAS
jgi:hypothetical protein